MREMLYNAYMRSRLVQENADKFKGRVLDVGCGTMPFRRMFWASDLDDWRPDCDVTGWVGLDFRAVDSVHADDFILADAEEMPIADNEFDTVLCTDVLQYAVNPAAIVNEMYRVLKPGGSILISVGNTQPDEGRDLWGIQTNGLRFLMTRAGFNRPVIMPGGAILTCYLDEWRHESKYALAIKADVEGFIAELDKKLPAMTFGVAQKE